MKISVVVPTYQRPQVLLQCVEALLDQAFSQDEYEIIVVSDGPDVETRHAIEKLKIFKTGLIKSYSLPRRSGPAAARNYGWRMASGKLILFTNDDCIPDSKWLQSYWIAFLRADGNKIAFTGKTSVPIPPVPTDYERSIAQLATAEFSAANCACTRAALMKVNGFDEQFTMAWREDSDLQFRFIEHNIPIIPVSGAHVTHPVRKAPWGISIAEEKKGIFNALLYKKFPNLYRERIQPSPPWHYYSILILILIFLTGCLAAAPIVMLTAFAGWFAITCWFIVKRLNNTSHKVDHILEMTVTSVVIPVISVYYRVYGALKYNVPLIL